MTPSGERLKGTHPKTYWWVYLSGEEPRHSEASDLGDFLVDATEQLRLAKDFMRNFVESGGEITISIGLFCPQNSGIVIPWKILARFASLRTGIDFDYYPGEPWSTSSDDLELKAS